MYYNITEAKYINSYIIEFKFKDGESGVVDFKEYCNRNGVFSEFKNIDFFKKFAIVDGVISWDNKLDIAPETVYSKATGKDLPKWMEAETSVVMSI